MDLRRLLKKWLMLPLAARYVCMPGRSYRGKVELTAIERDIERNLRKHLKTLAVDIGERNVDTPAALEATRDYIRNELARWVPDVHAHEFTHERGTGKNFHAATNPQAPRKLIVGAHYDTVPGSAGANDNGTGIAVLLELARLLQLSGSQVGVLFAAFDNEEHVGQPPESMGSRAFAQNLPIDASTAIGMWSLETLGFYRHEPNTQKFPAPLDLFYPHRGNFVGFVGNAQSRDFVRKSVRMFRSVRAGFPSEGIAAPAKFRDVERSDHRWFWDIGVPALMITDTANFRYPAYHTAGDTIDNVDFVSLARITRILAEVAARM